MPDKIFARIRALADQDHRTIEAIVIDPLADATCLDDDLPADVEAAIAAISLQDEPALRVAAESRLSKQESIRLEELHFRRQKDGLARAEEKECRELMQRYEKAMIIRAKAIAELHKRGVDVAELIAPCYRA